MSSSRDDFGIAIRSALLKKGARQKFSLVFLFIIALILFLLDVNQFKIIKLRCGFDERNHGYLNPCNDVYMDKLPSVLDNVDQENSYKAVPFYPLPRREYPAQCAG